MTAFDQALKSARSGDFAVRLATSEAGNAATLKAPEAVPRASGLVGKIPILQWLSAAPVEVQLNISTPQRMACRSRTTSRRAKATRLP